MGFPTTRTLAGYAALMLGLALSNTSRADAVGPPPPDCPPGSWGQTTHYGPHCAPYSCTTDSQCKKDHKCLPHGLCISERTHTHQRGDTHVVEVHGSCATGQACPEGSECRKGSYCMLDRPPAQPPSAKPATGPPTPSGTPSGTPSPGAPPATTPPNKGCGGCATATPTPDNPSLGVALILLVASTLARRRTRRSNRQSEL